jgi:biopolymer transport protein ExbD
MKVRVFYTVVLCCAANLTACRSGSEQNSSSTTSPPAPPSDAPSMKIWIFKTGSVEIDGKQVEVESVGPMLTELAQRKGEVFYGREAAEEDPHPNGMKVLQMVIANQVPVRMSTKRDFSDAVRLDGKRRE